MTAGQDEQGPADAARTRRRETLVRAVAAHGNVTAATTAAGYRSRATAYRWLARHALHGTDGLRDRPRGRPATRHEPRVVEAVLAVAREQPELGRRRIAAAVTTHLGLDPGVLTPHGVASILRDASSRRAVDPKPTSLPAWILPDSRIDLDALIERLQEGATRDGAEESARAVAVLHGEVWRFLEMDEDLWPRLLGRPVIGNWLLRSRAQLGHALLNHGRAAQGQHVVAVTRQWMAEWLVDHRCGPSSAAWEDAQEQMDLRWDVSWLYSHQLLAVFLEKTDQRRALLMLQTALHAVERPFGAVRPINRVHTLGNLHRSIVKVVIAAESPRAIGGGWDRARIERGLAVAMGYLEAAGDADMLAVTHMQRAEFHSRLAAEAEAYDRSTRVAALEAMGEAVETALGLLTDAASPILRTNLAVDAAQVRLKHGMAADVDWGRIGQAAAWCAQFGYAGQARQLLALEGVERHIDEGTRLGLDGVLAGMNRDG